MKDIVTFFDNLPWIVKIIFALPLIDGIAWGIYRIAKGIDRKDMILVIAGIIWVFVGFFLFWILDMITIILRGKPTIFA